MKVKEIEVDEILIASGRKSNVEGLSLENARVEYSDNGIKVNDDFSTRNPSIYAAGDVVDQRYRLETLMSSLPTSLSIPLAMVSCFFIILTLEPSL